MPESPRTFAEVVDVPGLKDLMASFHEATRIPVGICDAEGHWVVALGWQDICVNFHRANPESAQRCVESDRHIAQHLHEGRTISYRCVHGLMDTAFPLVVDGTLIGTCFIGQFLHEPADRDWFRSQAERYGYEIEGYLAALASVPVVSEGHVEQLMRFFQQLITLITRLGHENVARRRAEADLKGLNTTLEAAVAERTSALSEAVEKLAHQAIHDALTGLFNRRHFQTLLEDEVARVTRYGGTLALIMLDIDEFKSINDAFGHIVGDEVLKRLGATVRGHLRATDRFSRWGGEEFAIILPSTDLAGARGVAERIRQGVAAMAVPLVGGRVTISLGVAEWHRGSAEALLQDADQAMYAAKRNGRNRVEAAAGA